MDEVVFEGRVKTRAERLANALGIVVGAAKLIERARSGDPAESDSNARCTAQWLRVAADDLDALAKGE
ncbi:hypothetical protein PQQ87_24175 [Paraburkholderia nemoris]|uniref:hypothetical protein n=1 Tax=Paraburkholderia nemoris TaxID=2793076 RepID=UPI0038BA78AA